MTGSELKRTPYRFKSPGPYLAVVKNTIDSDLDGRIEVSLIRGFVDNTERAAGQFVRVNYLSPFSGSTSVSFNDNGVDNKATFNGTQKSYGMWMVPPDVGNIVVVFFIDGYINDGYWIGCASNYGKNVNYMTPGIASAPLPSEALTQEERNTYGEDPFSSNGTFYLPVAEINKNLGNKGAANNPPVHTPFALQLLQQGLLYDRVRGATSSSAKRESPSAVFGISTPGPLDTSSNNYQRRLDTVTSNKDGKSQPQSIADLPASRLGGNQFVMDDGDVNGDNELIRLRTRSGIQLLLHNTKDLVYITNSRGTAWIEMTSNGKIDIFAQDSVSINTDADFNLRAGRNFNIEAAQNVNIKSFNDTTIDTGGSLKIVTTKQVMVASSGSIWVNSKGNIEVASQASTLLASQNEVGITGGTVNVSGTVNMTSDVNVAGKLSSSSAELQASYAGPQTATTANPTAPKNLQLFEVPMRAGGAAWAPKNYYDSGLVLSSMRRVPTHEPWDYHEDIDPVKTSSDYTDNTADITPVALADPIPGEWAPPSDKNNSIGFTNGSGDAAHFAQLLPAMKKAIQQAADTYKKATGRQLIVASSFRSQTEQQALYNAWVKAGGKGQSTVFVPGVGNVTSPAEKASAHSTGLALDTPQATWLLVHKDEKTGLSILKACGLQRPLPWDPNHITLV